LDRTRHFLNRVEVSSTEAARLSLIPRTSSIEAAISLIEDDVCSAATAKSSEFRETLLMLWPISSIAAAFSAIPVAKSSESRLTDFTEADISCIVVRISWPEEAISSELAATVWTEVDNCLTDTVVCVALVATCSRFAVTFSTDDMSTSVDAAVSSLEPATDAACVAVSFKECASRFASLIAASRLSFSLFSPAIPAPQFAKCHPGLSFVCPGAIQALRSSIFAPRKKFFLP
jgi:hypothetical protein